MFTGYFSLGGIEVGNRRRAYEYARLSECPMTWLKLPSCEPVENVLGHSIYTPLEMEQAPWWEPDNPEMSRRFFGFYPLSITNISDSTWVGSIREGIQSGGVNGPGRHAARQVRVRGFMVARGEDALEHGMTWLTHAITPGRCDVHGDTCGNVDMMFFAACPRDQDFANGETGEQYDDYVRSLRRYIHGVKPLSGVIIVNQMRRGEFYAYEVEFTLSAEDGHVYGFTEFPDLATSEASTVLDSPYNLLTVPSAEKLEANDPTSLVATNLVTNPSFELNTNGWSHFSSDVSGSISAGNGSPTLTRSTILAAVGDYSGMVRLLFPGTATASGECWVGIRSNDIDVSYRPYESSLSITAWAAAVAATVGSVAEMRMRVAFYSATGWTIRETNYPASELSGNTWQLTTALPEGAAKVRVEVSARVSWVASSTNANNSDHRLYLDAVAVMIP